MIDISHQEIQQRRNPTEKNPTYPFSKTSFLALYISKAFDVKFRMFDFGTMPQSSVLKRFLRRFIIESLFPVRPVEYSKT